MHKYPKQQHITRITQNILNFWKQNDIFKKSLDMRSSAPHFTFYEGPPSANGMPGIHHVLSRTIKDVFCRYKTQQGFYVPRKAGWDTHGLPVELEVEKKLGITKEDIGKKISITDYNNQCKQTVMQYQVEWHKLTESIGYWIDTNSSYITFDTNYIESLWYILKQLYDKKFLYKGYTIQPYSPAAGTGLSSHELNQPGCYKLVKDISIVAQFKLANTINDYFLAWTTTPWTLPANSALAVGENIEYIKVRTFNKYTHQPINVILAKAALSRFFHTSESNNKEDFEQYKPDSKNIPWKVVHTYTGKNLLGISYDQIMPYIVPEKPAFRIISGDFVTTQDGTGIVHIAPNFGADDMRVAQKNGIPPITVNRNNKKLPIVDTSGCYVEEITDYAGKHVKEAYVSDETRNCTDYKSVDVLIATELKKKNKAFLVEKHEHSYPHCWRTDKPILYYPLDSWFIRTTAFKDRLIDLNKTINWHSESTGTGRFGNWLENLVDWNLSRDRYWGTPLPIWRTKDMQEEICIGSIDQLRNEVSKAVKYGFMKENLDPDIDLHRPYVDNIVLVSPQGKPMYRETDIVDVWFDSGAMPYAQWHYPFENNNIFNSSFPADFIAEGIDQTRGWFFTLHTLAVMLHDKVAFKNVIATGLVLDKNGNKMSKRLGNGINPFEIINQYGPDALRWYMISNSNPSENLKFDPKGVEDISRRFLGTLQNVYAFFELYANIDEFVPTQTTLAYMLLEIDKWIISRLNSIIKLITIAYDAYDATTVARTIQNFVIDDLSNWYVRLNRKRFWKSEQGPDKQVAYNTLYNCMLTIAKLMAPIAPFYSDQLYQNLTCGNTHTQQSIHLTDFPKYDESLINNSLEQKMLYAQKITSLAHSLRKSHNIKVRQPLQKIIVPISDPELKKGLIDVIDLIMDEINVKKVEFADNNTVELVKKIRPNFKTLVPDQAFNMQFIIEAVKQFSQKDILDLESTKSTYLNINGTRLQFSLDNFIITSENIPGWEVATDDEITIALDISLTDDLRYEGMARDIVNRIQNLRKDQNLDVQDKIRLTLASNNTLVQNAINNHKLYISNEVQALTITLVGQLESGIIIEIDGHNIIVDIEVCNA